MLKIARGSFPKVDFQEKAIMDIAEEAERALMEHGYFKVLRGVDVTPTAEKNRMLDKWQKEQQAINDFGGSMMC